MSGIKFNGETPQEEQGINFNVSLTNIYDEDKDDILALRKEMETLKSQNKKPWYRSNKKVDNILKTFEPDSEMKGVKYFEIDYKKIFVCKDYALLSYKMDNRINDEDLIGSNLDFVKELYIFATPKDFMIVFGKSKLVPQIGTFMIYNIRKQGEQSFKYLTKYNGNGQVAYLEGLNDLNNKQHMLAENFIKGCKFLEKQERKHVKQGVGSCVKKESEMTDEKIC